ncbi:MAG TPA: DMT family transporter [Gemmatimonadaceae bacterium]|nr:DMT family transporter [Gemmatimonadaceae bacterium]
MSNARAALFILLSAVCFSTLGIFTVIATDSGTPLPTVLAGRYLVAAVLLFAIARRAALVRRAVALRIVAAGLGQAVIAFTALSSLRFITVATMVFLFYTYPAWTAVLAVIRGTEKLDARHVGALALALGGTAVMVGSPWSAQMDWRGVALALTSAVLFAIYVAAIARLQRDVNPTATSAFVCTGAGTAFILGGAVAGAHDLTLAPEAILSILGLAVVCTTIGFILFLKGLAVLGPVRTAIMSTIEPFSAAVLGWLILGQPFRTPTIAGGVMIAAAVLLLLTSTRVAIEPQGFRERSGPYIS